VPAAVGVGGVSRLALPVWSERGGACACVGGCCLLHGVECVGGSLAGGARLGPLAEVGSPASGVACSLAFFLLVPILCVFI
jgi:hypothetical protein